MSDIARLMAELVDALPDDGKWKTVREACLTLEVDGTWTVLAGGSTVLHIGEAGGDFRGEGPTAEEAIAKCLDNINRGIRW